MGEYMRPGVYVKEKLNPLPQPPSNPGEAVGAFIGVHTAGPTDPTLITSWSQFLSLYRGFGDGRNYLPFSVYQFFANGGKKCYVCRPVAADATKSSLTIKNRPETPPATFGGAAYGGPPAFGGTTAPTNGNTGGRKTKTAAPAAEGVVPPTVPVGGLNVVASAIDSITLGWAASSEVSPEEGGGYDIYQGDPSAAQKIGHVDAPAVQYAVTGLSADTPYTFQVLAMNSAGDGPKSDPFTTRTPRDKTVPVDCLRFDAKAAGSFGNSINISVQDGWEPGRFHLFIYVGGTTDGYIVERYMDVSLDPADSRYVIGIVNSPVSGSKFLTLTNLMTGEVDDTWYPSTVRNATLLGGRDGSQPVSLTDAMHAFDSKPEVLNINLPGISDPTIINPWLTWAEDRGTAFIVIDPPPALSQTADAAFATYYGMMPGGSGAANQYQASSFGAVYGPWTNASDPAGSSRTAVRLLPPGGAMLGRYMTADNKVGPNQAAAGVDYALANVLGAQYEFSNDQLDRLNEVGFNVIRPQNQSGLCAMGVRTLRSGMPDRYIPVRRMLQYLRQNLADMTRFAIFKPNGPDLWATLQNVCTQWLQSISQVGMLSGTREGEAFFVQCDDKNNTPDTVALGEVHILIGVAILSPAEFIIIEIGQYQGGSVSSDSTGK